MPVIKKVELTKEYEFMYEGFLLTTQRDLYLFLEEDKDFITAIKFTYKIYKFGYPNDEVLSSHPMWAYGLRSYGIYEVLNSPWIEEIKHSNRIHPHHSDTLFENDRHFIISYKDHTLDVICKKMEEIVLKKEDIAIILTQEINYIGKDC